MTDPITEALAEGILSNEAMQEPLASRSDKDADLEKTVSNDADDQAGEKTAA